MKKYQINCPYCGAPAICRPANTVHGSNTWQKSSHLYICSHWPDCDSYVAAHKKNLQPMGSLANKSLRHKRIQAHQALEELRQNRHMEKWAVYIWLEMKLKLSPDEAHIAMFSEAMCDKLISICQESLQADRVLAA